VNRARARQWSRTAFALAALFGSFPVAGRILMGEWSFEGAFGLACLWLAIGAYLHVRARRLQSLPDPAARLDDAIHRAENGDLNGAFRVLDRTIAESPWFWQAFQRRAELRVSVGEIEAALDDFDQAILLAPDEPHLRQLRTYAESLLDPGDAET
jgi:hypothetical protein